MTDDNINVSTDSETEDTRDTRQETTDDIGAKNKEEGGAENKRLSASDFSEEANLAKVRKIMQIAKENYPKSNVEKIMHAYEVANTMHRGQKRKSGEPFIDHPLEVALMLAEMHAAPDCIAAGMLHDVVEDTSLTIDDVQAEFGSVIAALVDGVTKLKKIGGITKEEQQAENLRKMVMHIAEDPRVVVIKLVDRLHNMRTLQYMNTDQQMQKARETLEIYAPLAHRFGMSKIKWELEDLSFKYLDPIGYEEIAQQLNMTRKNREEFIERIINIVRAALEESGITDADIDGRPKHIYSIKRKMENRQKRLDQIYDLLAIRIIVDTEAQCYAVLGIVHHMFNIVDDRFKDYISRPKPNGYRSIHTTVMANDGTPFEVQIRTHEMHNMAEMGIAAHWRYKEGKNDTSTEEIENYEWVRTLYESQKDEESSDEFMEAFKMNLYTDEVFVYTPKGDVKVLPQGSTPIDFAYCIHSDIGNRMVGAKVNGELKPLDYTLKTGDKVDIITSNAPNRGPSRDWLKIVKSPEARSKLRQWFKKERRDENIELGRIMLERELKRQAVTYQELFDDQEAVGEFLKRCNLRSIDDMLNSLGFGDLTALKVITRLKDINAKRKMTSQTATEPPTIKAARDGKPKPIESVSENGVIVQGMSNCLVKIAKCCNPVPGDMIIGYTTRTSGVSVHRSDCPNVKAMAENEPARMIQVRWASERAFTVKHTAEIKIEAIDDGQTLIKVANAVNEMAIKMTSFSSRSKDNILSIEICVDITDRQQLDLLIKRIEMIDTVSKVMRPVR